MMWLYRTGQSAERPEEVGCSGCGYVGQVSQQTGLERWVVQDVVI